MCSYFFNLFVKSSFLHEILFIFILFNISPLIFYNDLNNISYLDLITETSVYPNSDFLFITEKTYRSIANGNIFLIMGCPGTIKYLQEKGIQTFNDLFDESYDQYASFSQRWHIIKQNIKLWISMSAREKKSYYIKSFDKLLHNQKLLYDRNFKKEITELFQ